MCQNVHLTNVTLNALFLDFMIMLHLKITCYMMQLNHIL